MPSWAWKCSTCLRTRYGVAAASFSPAGRQVGGVAHVGVATGVLGHLALGGDDRWDFALELDVPLNVANTPGCGWTAS